MLLLLYTERNYHVELLIDIANNGSPEKLKQIVNRNAADLLKYKGKKMKALEITTRDINRYIKNSEYEVDIQEYPVLVHKDATDNFQLFYMSQLFNDEFLLADEIEKNAS